MTSRLLIPPHGHSLRGPRRTAFTLTNAESEASGATSDNIARKLPDVARPHDRTAARSPQLDRTLQELMLRTLFPASSALRLQSVIFVTVRLGLLTFPHQQIGSMRRTGNYCLAGNLSLHTEIVGAPQLLSHCGRSDGMPSSRRIVRVGRHALADLTYTAVVTIVVLRGTCTEGTSMTTVAESLSMISDR